MKAKKLFTRIIASTLSAALTFAGFSFTASADGEPKPLPFAPIDGSMELADMFFLRSNRMEVSEDSGSYLLTVARGTADLSPRSVRVSFTDITAGYGTDYTVSEYKGKAKAENADSSTSIFEVFSENAGDIEEINYTADEIAAMEKALCGDEEQQQKELAELSSDEIAALTEENLEKIGIATVGDSLGEALDDPIVAAKERALGITSDRVPASSNGGNMNLDMAGLDLSQLAELNGALDSAYIILDFDEDEIEKTLKITVFDNDVSDGDKRFNIDLTAESEGARIAPGLRGISAVILDDEERILPHVSFTADRFYAEDGLVTVRLTRDGGLRSLSSVKLITRAVTAVEGRDYSRTETTVAFPFGISERTVCIPIRSEYIREESVSFEVFLDECAGCTIDGKECALCIVSAGDESYVPETDEAELFADQNSRKYGDALDFSIFTPYASSDSKGWVGVNRSGYFELFAEYAALYIAWSNYVTANADVPDTIFWNGLSVKWKLSHDSGVCNFTTTVYQNGKTVFSSGADDWGWTTSEIMFTDDETTDIGFKVHRERVVSPRLEIEYIKPILRPIDVYLVPPTPLTFLAADGTRVIPGDDSIATYISGGSNTGTNSVTVYDGNSVSISMKNQSSSNACITAIEVLDEDDNILYTFTDFPENAQNASVTVAELAPYITISKFSNESNGKYGTVYLRPVLGYLPVTVTVNRDPIANLYANGELKSYTDTESVYEFHKGDIIRITQTIKDRYTDDYTASEVEFTPLSGDLTGTHHKISYVSGTNYANYAAYEQALEVSAVTRRRDNSLRIRVDEAAHDYLTAEWMTEADNSGSFTEIDGDREYVFADEKSGDFSPDAWYEVTAYSVSDALVPVWYNYLDPEIKYCQDTMFFRTNYNPDMNVLYLTAVPADSEDNSYVISARTFYDDIPMGGTHGAQGANAAEGVIVSTGSESIGVSDLDGYLMTMPFSGKENYYVIYKVYANGTTQYIPRKLVKGKMVQVETVTSDEGESTFIDCYEQNVGNIYAPNINRLVPYPSYINIYSSGNLSAKEISIDKNISTTIYVGVTNTAVNYTDTAGVARTETPVSLEFLVYSGRTNEFKASIGTSKYDSAKGRFFFGKAFEAGNAAEYAAGDKLYIRMTTNRYVGDGTAIMEEGEAAAYVLKALEEGRIINAVPVEGKPGFAKVPVDYMQETVYAPVNTGVTFVEPAPLPDLELDFTPDVDTGFIELPFIGHLTTAFNCNKIAVTFQQLEENKVRVGLGYAWSHYDEGHTEGATNPDGSANPNAGKYKPDFSGLKDIKAAKDSGKAKALDKNGVAAVMGMSTWGWAPMVGIYIDFALKQLPGELIPDFYFCGGGAFFGISGFYRLTGYMFIFVFPLYIGVELYGDAVLNIGFTYMHEDELKLDKFKNMSAFNFAFSITANVGASVYAGVGIDHSIGVRGGFMLDFVFLFDPMVAVYHPEYHVWGVQVYFALRIWIDLLLLTIPVTVSQFVYTNFGYFDDIKQQGSPINEADLSEMSSSPGDVTAELGAARKKPRGGASDWKGDDTEGTAELLSTYEGVRTDILKEGGYDKASPKLAELGDGRLLLVFLDEDPERDDGSYTVLRYSVFDGTVWSEPETLQDDGSADFEPDLCDAGDSVLITWVSRSKADKFETPADMNDFEIYTVLFDKKTEKPGSITRLTNDNYYNSDPVGVYNDVTGDIQIFYNSASEFTEEDEFMNAMNPFTNYAERMYVYYDASLGKWMFDEYYDGELADPGDEAFFTENFGGQRFLNTGVEEFGLTDPTAYSFDAASYGDKNICVYAVDRDSNLDTTADTELIMRIFDTTNHVLLEPACLSSAGVSIGRPQLIKNGDKLYLFWLEEEKYVRYIEISKLLENSILADGSLAVGAQIEKSAVFFGSILRDEELPSFATFIPFVDKEGHLFITWTEGIHNEEGTICGAEVYASAFLGETADGKKIGSAWSKGVKLTDSGCFNDELDFIVTDGDHLIIAGNRFELDLEKDEYETKNVCLTVTHCIPASSVEATSITLPDKTQLAVGKELTLNITYENTGLKPVEGFVYEVRNLLDGEADTTTEPVSGSRDVIIPPSGTYTDTVKIAIPKDIDGKEYRITVSSGDKCLADTSILTYTSEPIEKKPELRISGGYVTQENEGFLLHCTVKNEGGKDLKESDGASVFAAFNDIYYTRTGSETFGETALGAVKSGQKKNVEFLLDIPEERLDNGYCFAYIVIKDKNGKEISDPESATVNVKRPYDIDLAQAKDGQITVTKGENTELVGSFAPSNYFIGGNVLFTSSNTDVVTVDDEGILCAVNEGTATLTAFVEPYGGVKSFPVTVLPASEQPDEPDEPQDEPDEPDDPENPDEPVITKGRTVSANTTCIVSFKSNCAERLSSVQMRSGEKLKELPTPENGEYIFGGWYSDPNLSESFDKNTAITKNTTLYAKWLDKGETDKPGASSGTTPSADKREEESETVKRANPYTDLEEDAWYFDSVLDVTEQGIMNGTGNGHFSPEESLTRAMFATVLWRLAGEPEAAGTKKHVFNDVKDSDYFAEAVAWAYEIGIIKGTSHTEFSPDDPITHEQMAAMIDRYAAFTGLYETSDAVLPEPKGFAPDADKISAYAYAAVVRCARNGIIRQTEDGLLKPGDVATRAEAAAALARASELSKKE